MIQRIAVSRCKYSPDDVIDAKVMLFSGGHLQSDFSVSLDTPDERMLFDLESQLHSMKID